MHKINKTVLCCLVLTQNGKLCRDLVRTIYELCEPGIKRYKQNEQKAPFTGTSKSARKRRQRRYERCMKCGYGLNSHRSRCRPFPTQSQEDYITLIRQGPIRVFAEGIMREGSMCFQTVIDELLKIEDLNIERLRTLTLRDLGLENHPNARLPSLDAIWGLIGNDMRSDTDQDLDNIDIFPFQFI